MKYCSTDTSTAPANAPLILVVEDEEEVAAAMEYKLKLEGFATRVALNGESALREMVREPLPNLVLLDIMLPDVSGLDLCVRLRDNAKTRHVPVIMLTAKGEEINRVLGFEVGADDYLVKPFSIRELMLRIQVVLRRNRPPEPDPVAHRPLLKAGCLTLDVESHRAFVKGQEVDLTHTQFKLLHTLMERSGSVFRRDALLDLVWGVSAYVQTRTVDCHVKELRRQLGEAADYIETVRGVGYRFVKPEVPTRP